MNEPDLHYLAGFFDGEGCISILKRKRKDRIVYFTAVQIGQKDARILDWVATYYGGNVYTVKRDKSFSWLVTDRKAYQFIRTIAPYLRYKQPQAILAIRFYEELIDSGLQTNRKLGLSEKAKELREDYYLEMKYLKQIFVKSTYSKGTPTTTERLNNRKIDVTV